jgi:hypothetical protein
VLRSADACARGGGAPRAAAPSSAARDADGRRSASVAYREAVARGALVLAALLVGLAGCEVAIRVLVPPARWLAPPAPRTIDPYAPSPFVVTGRPFMHVFLPHATFVQARAGYAVRYRINGRGFR